MFRTDAQPLPGYLTGWPVAQPDDPLSNWAGTAAALACMAPVARTIRQRLRKAATTPDCYHHHANLI